MAGLPPGNESKVLQQQAIENELLGFLRNDCITDFSNYKGQAYVYKMNDFTTARGHLVEQVKATNQLVKGIGLTKLPEWRYPVATRRVFGNVNPGEFERRARKTSDRKKTRGEVELLCKFMLFKKKKFTPGKLV